MEIFSQIFFNFFSKKWKKVPFPPTKIFVSTYSRLNLSFWTTWLWFRVCGWEKIFMTLGDAVFECKCSIDMWAVGWCKVKPQLCSEGRWYLVPRAWHARAPAADYRRYTLLVMRSCVPGVNVIHQHRRNTSPIHPPNSL